MGTRATIQIVGSNSTDAVGSYNSYARLYRNWEGEPHITLRTIAAAIFAIEQRMANDQLWIRRQVRHVAVDVMSCAVVFHAMGASALEVVVDGRGSGVPELWHLGDRGDIEWLYVVDCCRQAVNVYTADQGLAQEAVAACREGPATDHLGAGVVKDIAAASKARWKPEFAAKRAEQWKDAQAAIVATGWAFGSWIDPYAALVRRNREVGRRAA